jgi:hypothetical protein
MDAANGSSPGGQQTNAGDGLASTLDQLAALMAQAEELASWASSTNAVEPQPEQAAGEPEGAAGEPEGAAGELDAEANAQSGGDHGFESGDPAGSEALSDSQVEDPIGAALMSMVSDGRIAAVVVAGEGSAEMIGEPRCVEESSLVALSSLAPVGAVLEVTTTQGELRALRVGSWTFAVEVGATAPADVDALLGELLALSQEGISGADR